MWISEIIWLVFYLILWWLAPLCCIKKMNNLKIFRFMWITHRYKSKYTQLYPLITMWIFKVVQAGVV